MHHLIASSHFVHFVVSCYIIRLFVSYFSLCLCEPCDILEKKDQGMLTLGMLTLGRAYRTRNGI